MTCCQETNKEIKPDRDMKVLLMGNPNVGKSVVFSKLTGVHVDSSNYTGTTVDYTVGDLNYRGRKGVLIDVPGIYSLSPISDAEKLAVGLLKEGADVIICVLDSTHLERNLHLAYELKKYGIPIIYSLNLSDVAERQGIHIDEKKLAEELNAPVVKTVAIKNQGLREVLDDLVDLVDKKLPVEEFTSQEVKEKSKKTAKKVESYVEREISFIDKLEDWTIKPFPGVFIAILVLAISIGLVVGGGKAIRSLFLLPLVKNVISPLFTNIVSLIVPEGILRNVLVGEFGVLIIGIEWPFALIMPYVFLFYVVFSFLEDSGYLPRLGVLADGLLRKIGIQGGNIIPLMMGYGCAVPAILGTRASNTYKERIMVAALVSFAIPCASQSAAFFSLLGDRSILALILVYLMSFLVMIVVGLIMNKFVKGQTQPMILEIPNLLIPDKTAFKKKLKIKMRHFLLDAEGPMLIGIIIAAFVAETGILNSFSEVIEPLVVNWLGLPKEASLSLLLGIIRRELAVLPLLDLDLTTLQLLVGSTVALFYLPCLSVFGVLIKEFSLKIASIIGLITIVSAFVFAGLINQIGQLILAIV